MLAAAELKPPRDHVHHRDPLVRSAFAPVWQGLYQSRCRCALVCLLWLRVIRLSCVTEQQQQHSRGSSSSKQAWCPSLGATGRLSCAIPMLCVIGNCPIGGSGGRFGKRRCCASLFCVS